MYYVVAEGNAYCLDSPDGAVYGAPVREDNTVAWEDSYEIALDCFVEEEVEYISHCVYHLQKIAALTTEHLEVFYK